MGLYIIDSSEIELTFNTYLPVFDIQICLQHINPKSNSGPALVVSDLFQFPGQVKLIIICNEKP